MIRVLYLGDIISRVGRGILRTVLPRIKDRLGVDLCIANVENAAGMFGVTETVIEEIVSTGVDVMTSGNHIWDKREGIRLLDSRTDLLRPANYPPGVEGRGMIVTKVGGTAIAVVNLQGRVFMPPIDCPFRKADEIITQLKGVARIILVDFHAEATSEKIAMGFYLDGRVSAVAGTHTHVQTADERILGGGTAYITDIGMVGARNSIIGVRKEQVISRFLTQVPVRFQVATEEPALDGFFVEIDETSGTALRIERLRESIEGVA